MTEGHDRHGYAEEVLKLYRTANGTTGRTSFRDRRLAEVWFDRGVPLTTVKMALVLAERRRQRSLTTPRLGPIRSLHYFVPIIAELLAAPPPPGYLAYLAGSPEPGPP